MLHNLPGNNAQDSKVIDPVTVKIVLGLKKNIETQEFEEDIIEVALTDEQDIQLYNFVRNGNKPNLKDLQLAIARHTFSPAVIFVLSSLKYIDEATLKKFIIEKSIPADDVDKYICFQLRSKGFINELVNEKLISQEKVWDLLAQRKIKRNILPLTIEFVRKWHAAISSNQIDVGSTPAHVARLDELYLDLLALIRDRALKKEKEQSKVNPALLRDSAQRQNVLAALTDMLKDFLIEADYAITIDELEERLKVLKAPKGQICEELAVVNAYVNFVREYGEYFYNMKAVLMGFKEEVSSEHEKVQKEKLRISAQVTQEAIDAESSDAESSAQAELAAAVHVQPSAEAGHADLRRSSTLGIHHFMRNSGSAVLTVMAPMFEKMQSFHERLQVKLKSKLSKFDCHAEMLQVTACLSSVTDDTQIDEMFDAFNAVLNQIIDNAQASDDHFRAYWTSALEKMQKLRFKPVQAAPVIQVIAESPDEAPAHATAKKSVLSVDSLRAANSAHPSPRLGHRTPGNSPRTSPVMSRMH